MTLSRRHFALASAVLLGAPSAAVLAAQGPSAVAYFRAVGIDNASGAKAELVLGLSPNTLSEQGQTALFLAIRDDAPRVLELLLGWPGINLNLANPAGETPLMMAALRGNLAVMKRLVGLGAAVHKDGWSAIHYAATGPSAEAVAWLLEQGAPADARSPNGSTPLMMAARYGSERAVDVLLAQGAHLQQRNDAGLTPLDFARHADRDWMVRKLEKLGAKSGGA